MKFRFSILVLAAAFGAHPTLRAQGSLMPPGPPAPTMKTLDQIEARTPIPGGTSTVFISAGGSYYLTGPVYVGTGDGITITSGNVTLDLNGFEVTSTAASPNGSGVSYTGGGNFVLRNGHIQGATTAIGTPPTFTPGGFSYGVNVAGVGRTVLIENVDVAGVADTGIRSQVLGTTISRCRTKITAVNGINAPRPGSTVDHCSVRLCNGSGITAGVVSDCDSSTVTGTAILASNAANCYAESGSGSGLSVTGGANNCSGYSASSTGMAINAASAVGCYGSNSSSGTGIGSPTAQGCYAYSATGTALSSENPVNCYAVAGSGIAISATSATSCHGSTFGTTSAAVAVDCGTTGTATHCSAAASNSVAVCLRARIAIGCTLSGGQAVIANRYNMP